MLKRFLPIFLIFFLFPFFSLATNYYVSPNGDDANIGTSAAAPFQTLDKINSMTFFPGDIISLEGGQTFTGYLVIDDSGTAANPITLNAYNGGIATIQFDALGTSKFKAVEIKNASHFIVKDLNIIGSYISSTDGSMNPVQENVGLDFDAASTNISNITADNVTASGFEFFGIKVVVATGFTIDQVNILNCRAHNNGFTGIQVKGDLNSGITNISNLLIDNCLADYNEGWDSSACGNGIQIKNVINGIIQNSEAHHNGGNNGIVGSGGGGGIWASECENIIFQYNESHHNETGNADGIGFDFDGGVTNSIMQFNYAHHNDGGGFLAFQYGTLINQNIHIRYNISENDGLNLKQGAVHCQLNSNVQNNMENIFIYNNTIYNDNPAVAMVEIHDIPEPFDILNTQVYNNLFIQPNGGLVLGSVNAGTATLVNNFVEPTDGNASVVNAGNGVLNDYQIQSNSPLIDAGLDLANQAIIGFTDMGTQDFFGNPIPSNGLYDIGAHEYSTCATSELLVDGTFDALNSPTIPNWSFETLNGVATASINNTGYAVINIDDEGVFDFDVQLRQDNFAITAGTPYVLKIKAKAVAPRNINFKLRNRLDGSIKYLERVIPLTTTDQEFAYIINPTVSDNDLRLVFLFGADNNNVEIDYISFEEHCTSLDLNEVNCLEYITLHEHDVVSNTYHAKLNVLSNARIPTNGNVIFKAGESIDLRAGFCTEMNAVFEAIIEGCN